jgi:phage baseplate assembly protein W
MIPATNGLLGQTIEFREIPTYTWYLDRAGRVVYGFTDSRAAMEQAIYLILRTERYRHVIFSRDYGARLEDLFGMPTSFVMSEVQRRIQNALLHDTRITAVDTFAFETTGEKLLVTFTAHTIFGDLNGELTVDR